MEYTGKPRPLNDESRENRRGNAVTACIRDKDRDDYWGGPECNWSYLGGISLRKYGRKSRMNQQTASFAQHEPHAQDF
jgi:hypothetical protein